MKAQATIKDVAREAGVSLKTASRVANREGRVTPAKVEAVERAMQMLNYTPNLAARQLRTQRANLIALLINSPSSYVANLQFAMIKVCAELDLNLMVEAVIPGEERRSAERLRQLRVQGAVLASPLDVNTTLHADLESAGVAHVLVSAMQAGILGPTVGMDDFGAAKAMGRLLIETGHQTIGFIVGPSDNPVSKQRHMGFHAALQEGALSINPPLEIEATSFHFSSGLVPAETLLNAQPRPTAIFASNDYLALAALRVAMQRGLRVPEDLSIVGFDDVPAATMVFPKLTTIRQPLGDIARQAIGLLVTKSLPHYQHIGAGFELVERESLRPPAPTAS